MNRQRLLLVCLCALFQIAFYQDGVAQNTQVNKIGILPIKYESSDQADAARQVTDLLYNKFVSGKRAKVLDRQFFSDLKDEKFLTSSIDFIDGEMLDKTKSEGAKYLLIGKIASCSIEKNKYDNYTCQLNVGVRVINVETGGIEYSATLKNKSNTVLNILKSGSASTKGQAVSNAVSELEKSVNGFLNKYFPIEANVLEIHKEQKGKAKEVLVSIGSSDGISKKDKFLVLVRQTRTVGGEEVTFNEQIGEGAIKEINASSVSTFSVKKGGKSVLEKFNQGIQLVIVPK